MVTVDYEQIPDLDVNEISLITLYKIYDHIYLNTYHDYSFQANLWFTQGYGIRYVQGCWGFGVGYERVGSDNRFLFTVDLDGDRQRGQPGELLRQAGVCGVLSRLSAPRDVVSR